MGKKGFWDKKRQIAVISVWMAFLILGIAYYVRSILPSHRYYNINNPYTMDSVWDTEENDWHNDVLLYTLFSENTVYISPESWYLAYAEAFAGNLVIDDSVEAIVESAGMDMDAWLCLNHMIAVQNSTLFDQDVIETVTDRAPEGAAMLYIEEESVAALTEGILLFHDEAGNVYLKGYQSEEYR